MNPRPTIYGPDSSPFKVNNNRFLKILSRGYHIRTICQLLGIVLQLVLQNKRIFYISTNHVLKLNEVRMER
jgi:hypothetical protein